MPRDVAFGASFFNFFYPAQAGRWSHATPHCLEHDDSKNLKLTYNIIQKSMGMLDQLPRERATGVYAHHIRVDSKSE